ncbi:TetR family transcriptional regulator [Nocardia panacis]|uniref:TetR family transcriptional regulator n=1 Tax=Nocardia panacis TaxID=2340916 RepID=A0A3A4JYW1_9NOCA|nr:TetR family transcriptional regulator [Nocardia panacis]
MKEPTLWERSRQLAVREILDTAIRLFEEQGYEATTIAQIARAAGVSERSLFRYFGAKEDLVCGDQEALGRLLRAAVESQPGDVSPQSALEAGFAVILTANHSAAEALRLSRLIFATPSLYAAYVTKRLRWQEDLVPVIAERMAASDPADPRPRALIATVFACVDAATRAWVVADGRADIADLYARALTAITT